MAGKEQVVGLRKRGASQSHSMDGKEVLAANAPENVLSSSVPANNAPEVSSSNAPEILHEPRDFLPQLAPGLGLETNYEGIELDVPDKEEIPAEPKSRFSKRRKIWTSVVFASLLLAAIIAGAVNGTEAVRKSRYMEN